MKRRDMPTILAANYVSKTLPFEGTIDREISANRLRRAYMAGYAAARKRFTKRAVSKFKGAA